MVSKARGTHAVHAGEQLVFKSPVDLRCFILNGWSAKVQPESANVLAAWKDAAL